MMNFREMRANPLLGIKRVNLGLAKECPKKPGQRGIAMRFSGIVGLIFLAGCAKGDPETERLATGTNALAVYREGQERADGWPAAIPLIEARDPGAEFELYPSVDPGTKVLVLKDDEKGEDNPMRRVDVKVEDGRLQGRSGKMMRWSLRASR